MSIIVESGEFTHEITEDGELLFEDYDIQYDLAAIEFGYGKTPAVLFLERWEGDATTTFLEMMYNNLSSSMARTITRAWLDMVIDRLGVEKLEDSRVSKVLESIDAAIESQDQDELIAIETWLGFSGAAYQQGTWMHSSQTSGHGHENKKRLDLVSAITDYVVISRYLTPDGALLWSRQGQRGGKNSAIHYMIDIPTSCSFEIARKKLQQLPATHTTEMAYRLVKKEFVGAAVKAIVKAEGM